MVKCASQIGKGAETTELAAGSASWMYRSTQGSCGPSKPQTGMGYLQGSAATLPAHRWLPASPCCGFRSSAWQGWGFWRRRQLDAIFHHSLTKSAGIRPLRWPCRRSRPERWGLGQMWSALSVCRRLPVPTLPISIWRPSWWGQTGHKHGGRSLWWTFGKSWQIQQKTEPPSCFLLWYFCNLFDIKILNILCLLEMAWGVCVCMWMGCLCSSVRDVTKHRDRSPSPTGVS